MLTQAQSDQLQPALRTTQVIVGSLVFGALSFLVVVLVVTPKSPHAPTGEPIITYIAVAAAVFSFFAAIFAPAWMTRPVQQSNRDSLALGAAPKSSGQDTDSATLTALALYQTRLIVRCAILEGATFFCNIAYMIERNPLAFGAACCLVLMMLAQFPTKSRLESWLENKLVDDEQLRQLR